jgi:soluble lytic murein transglycosylase-like protein
MSVRLRLVMHCRAFIGLALAVQTSGVLAGAQQYEPLAAGVQAALHAAVVDSATPEPHFASSAIRARWLAEMSSRLVRRMPDEAERHGFLLNVHYEARRAGLDPQLVLALIEVESTFRRYAVSTAGARGLMQVMPFWTRLLADGDAGQLFDARVNLRYGCTIMRHYLDREQGNLFRALGRYNGSLGRGQHENLPRECSDAEWR